jgi:hypothetical protein
VGEPILLSANVTNVGEESGNYSVNLTINNVLKGNQTILLSGGNSSIVEFTDTEDAEGNYTVEIGGLTGSFKIKPAPPTVSNIRLSNIVISPYEAWVGETINATVTASNPGGEPDSLSVRLMVDDSLIETKRIQLDARESATVEFLFNVTTEGKHSVKVNTLTGSFVIVPTGKHSLLLVTKSVSGTFTMTVTIDGVDYTTPYSDLLPVGTHTISVQDPYETKTALFRFDFWNDGVKTATRTINLQSRLILIPSYTLISGVVSCPSLSVWNGTNYVYRAEVSAGTGYLPYFEYFGEKGTRVFGYSDPWDYIKLDRNQIQPRNGYYDMILTELGDEIFYMDSARLLVVDHSPDADVYSTYGTRLYILDEKGTIYTVSKNPSPPVSAVYSGQDVLAEVSKLDGIYATTPSGWKYGQWNTLELNLGNLSDAKEIKLIVNGMVVWPSSEVTTEWQAKFVTQPGVTPFPVQYMEVKDANGNWVRVPDNRQFPMLRASPDTFVVNLTGLFPTNDCSLRIHTFFDWRFDYIGVDATPQQGVIIQELYPFSAALTQMIETNSTSTGNFTRYGDVTELMLEADDKFVIGRRGDEIHVLFPANIEPVPEGMERDYFVVTTCWFKLPGLPYLPYTVDPLPFHAMSSYPYPLTESYPYNEAHLSYLLEYNTRIIPVLNVEAPEVPDQ